MTERFKDYREGPEPPEGDGQTNQNGANGRRPRRKSCMSRLRFRGQRSTSSAAAQFKDPTDVELAELIEDHENKRSENRDRKLNERLGRVERRVRLFLTVAATAVILYLLSRNPDMSPIAAGGLGLGAGIARVGQVWQERGEKKNGGDD